MTQKHTEKVIYNAYQNLETSKVILLNYIIVPEPWQKNEIIIKKEHKMSIKIIDNIHYDLTKFIFFKINIK